MSPHRPPRLPGFDYVGPHRYFLTICVQDRLRLFTRPDLVTRTLADLVLSAGLSDLSVFAYCFMPDHLHALLTADADNARFLESVRRFNQVSAFDHRLRTGTRLWQRGFFERVPRPDEGSGRVARYVLENPVRAGVVDTVEEYPFSGSAMYSKREMAALWEGGDGRV